MNTINCLIVDDEPIARDIIAGYCANVPQLHVVAACANAVEAKTTLQDQPIDIIFLDIHLPVLDGIGFLKVLKNPPQIIFTTAYREFAVTAFELDACDYLVKPFLFERFIIAVDKAIERLAVRKTNGTENDGSNENFLFIRAEGKIYKIYHSDLLYAEAKGNYTKIVTDKHTITPNISFTSFEKLLPSDPFVRVHRSFIVNKSKIDHIEGNRLFINKIEISIGSNYRDSFLKKIGFS